MGTLQHSVDAQKPQEDALVVPKFGEPCNGCGQCCREEACDLSVKYLKSVVAPCVALEFEGGRYWCGLVRNPAKYLSLAEWANEIALAEFSPRFAYMLRLGAGCDAYFGPDSAVVPELRAQRLDNAKL